MTKKYLTKKVLAEINRLGTEAVKNLTPQSTYRFKAKALKAPTGKKAEKILNDLSKINLTWTPQSMGRLGGLARAKKLSKQKRSAIAKLGGLARQKKEKK